MVEGHVTKVGYLQGLDLAGLGHNQRCQRVLRVLFFLMHQPAGVGAGRVWEGEDMGGEWCVRVWEVSDV